MDRCISCELLEKENKFLKKQIDGLNHVSSIDFLDNKALKARLSHLMDVAGKMAGALKEIADGATDCDYLHSKRLCCEVAKFALAEWDGIKDGI